MSQLEFYCCDCQLLFNAEPDGTGYEQSPCPQCQNIAMTSEFEGKATAQQQERMVIIAEFADEASAEPLAEKLDAAEIPLQINLPDLGDGDFFTGGNDNVCILVPASQADNARRILEGG